MVCWSSSHSSQAEFRKDVENHVITNFANTQRLRIQKGWKTCDSLKGQFDIGVVVYDDPAFQSLLKSNKSLTAKMSFGDRPGNPRVRDWGKFLRGDAHGLVLNTSGLGRHSAAVTPYDRNSIMNYCKFATSREEYNPELNSKIFHFSVGDIATLNKGY